MTGSSLKSARVLLREVATEDSQTRFHFEVIGYKFSADHAIE